MTKRITIITFLIVFSCIVQAHEFWLQPDKFFYQPGESLKVTFKVGENFMGESWNLKKHRIEKLELHSINGIKNLSQQVTEGETGMLEENQLKAGTQMIVMQSNNAFISLDGQKFNEYLKEDGLDEVYDHREKNNLLADSAKEFYSRHTKLLVQVGDKKDESFKKVIGLPIEIIPETNPYDAKVGSPMRFKVVFDNKPLFGAKVRVWNRYNNRTTVQNIYAEKDGVIETRISNPGSWMISVVKMVPSKDPKADWQSYWGSLVFGVK
jgi:uncharacterized GH25 family protein